MQKRLKRIRTELNLSQEKFGEKLGLSQNAIAKYESGLRTPQEQTIKAICREYNVSYDWLKYGEGEMFEDKTEIMDLVDRILSEEDEETKTLFKAFAKLDNSEWKALAKVIEGLTKK